MTRFLLNTIVLVSLGVGLGLLARQIFGDPNNEPQQRLLDPYSVEKSEPAEDAEPDKGSEIEFDLPLPPAGEPFDTIIEIPIHRDFTNVAQFRHDPVPSSKSRL